MMSKNRSRGCGRNGVICGCIVFTCVVLLMWQSTISLTKPKPKGKGYHNYHEITDDASGQSSAPQGIDCQKAVQEANHENSFELLSLQRKLDKLRVAMEIEKQELNKDSAARAHLRSKVDAIVSEVSSLEVDASIYEDVTTIYESILSLQSALYSKDNETPPTQHRGPLRKHNTPSHVASANPSRKGALKDCKMWDVGATEEHPLPIPRKIYTSWSNEIMFPEAEENDREWKEKEPCFQRSILTDTECQQIVKRVNIPFLRERYKVLPLKVMKADVCRLAAIYLYGGIYMDLDVQWAKGLDTWLNLSSTLIVGRASDKVIHRTSSPLTPTTDAPSSSPSSSTTHRVLPDVIKPLGNWFFAAEAGHPCIINVLHAVTENIAHSTTKEDFKRDPHLIQRTTGSFAFTESLMTCENVSSMVTLSADEMSKSFIKHEDAGKFWRQAEGYTSWYEERMLVAGLHSSAGIGLLPPEQQQYIYAPSATMYGDAQLGGKNQVVVERGRVSHAYFRGAPMFHSAVATVDSSLETVAQTHFTNDKQEHFIELTFATTYDFPLVSADALHCVKVFPAKDGDASFPFHPYYVETIGMLGEKTFVSEQITSRTPHLVHLPPGKNDKVQAITAVRIRANGGIRVAEVQFFRTPVCDNHQIIVPPPINVYARIVGDYAASLQKLLVSMSHQTYFCAKPHLMGETSDDGQLYFGCGLGTNTADSSIFEADDPAVSRSCKTLTIGGTLDSSFESYSYEFGCTPTVIDTKRNPAASNASALEAANENTLPVVKHKRFNKKGLVVHGVKIVPHHTLASLTPFEAKISMSIQQFLASAASGLGGYVSFLRLTSAELSAWDFIEDIVSLAKQKAIDQVGLELDLCSLPNDSKTVDYFMHYLNHIKTEFHISQVRAESEADTRKTSPFDYPCLLKLVIIRRQGLKYGAEVQRDTRFK